MQSGCAVRVCSHGVDGITISFEGVIRFDAGMDRSEVSLSGEGMEIEIG